GNEKVGNISIEVASIDRGHLVAVQRLLLNLGVYTRIYAGRKLGGMALLPDGNGDLKEYYQSQSWSLRAMDRTARETLYELVEWRKSHRTYWERRNASIRTDRYYNTHRFRATVLNIEPDGVEDVYDVTVENGHSVIFNGIATGQCSEILQVSTPSTYNDDLSYAHVGRDISCNLGSLNIAKAMDGGDLGATVETAVRGLTAVSDQTAIDSVPSIRRGNDESHSIGLGQMNLHGFLARERIHYGSEEALDFTDIYFTTVAFHAISASNRIAIERGRTFEGFEQSAYADGSYFAKYVEKDWQPKTQRVRDLFAQFGVAVPTREDWAQLA